MNIACLSCLSPLAGDINWMETLPWFPIQNIRLDIALSPLAGDINWMETSWFKRGLSGFKHPQSPLAGDINWMETNWILSLKY